jgi:hypothetical protein
MSTHNSYIPVSLHKMDTLSEVLLLEPLSCSPKNKYVAAGYVKIPVKKCYIT